MAVDAWGNYIATPTLVWFQSSGHPSTGGMAVGHGSPEGVVTADPGKGYLDLDSNDLWVKATDSGNTGWVQISNGGTGVTEVYFISGNPNGVTTAQRPAIAYDDSGRFWEKTGAGANNTGWEQLIGPPV